MKKILTAILACSFFFAACEKEKKVYCCGLTYTRYMGDGTFRKGDLRNWVDEEFQDSVKNNIYTLWTTKSDLALKLRVKYNKTAPVDATGYLTNDYEAVFYQYNYPTLGTLIYKLDSSASHSVRLKRFVGPDDSGVNREWLSGKFRFTFILSTPTGNMAFDTTRVYFSNGNFNVRLDN